MTSSRPSLLLTGASGVLGRALLDELTDDFDVICLRRRTPIGDARVREMHGDLTRANLGLTEHQLRQLRRGLHVIVHCAATTRFGDHPENVTATNVQGTEAVLDLAAGAGARLVHVSSAFVVHADRFGDRGGSATTATTATTATDTVPGPGAYLASKRAAEAMVTASGLDAFVVRPSLIMGDSQTGHIAGFQGLHRVFGAALVGALPLLPVSGEARVDLIPQDVVARAVARLLQAKYAHGTYWLSAGEHAPTIAEILDITAELAGRIGLVTNRPRLVSADMVGRLLVPLMAETLPAKLRRSFEQMIAQARLFQAEETFPSSLADIDPALVVSRADLLATFARSLEYWAQKEHWARTWISSVEAVA